LQASATLLGRAFNVLGYALAAYCVFKMFSCLKSVLFGEDFTSDPVSRVLGVALRLFSRGSLHLNVKAASQYVTLLFVGFVTFNSLRAFLKHMRRLAKAFEVLAGGVSLPGAGGGAVSAAERMMLGLGALLCAYTVSTVMLLRAQLPVAHRALVTQALGFDAAAVNSEFDAVHRCSPCSDLAAHQRDAPVSTSACARRLLRSCNCHSYLPFPLQLPARASHCGVPACCLLLSSPRSNPDN
jgi:hypothetical protein